MKLLHKLGLIALLGGVGASVLYAAPSSALLDATSGEVDQAIARSQQLHEQIAGDARHVQHLQEVARKEKDVIKLNCVNDKLVQLRPQLNMADRAASDLTGGHDVAGTLQIMTEAAEAIRKLREGADACIGEPLLGAESTNSFTHPDIDDPTDTNPWGNTFEPPAYASPMD